MIPLFKVYMSSDVDTMLHEVLHSGYIGEGQRVVDFETSLRTVVENNMILTTNSCTSAITMALRLAGVKSGDFVISTPMTCLATNEPILALGATPLWADIDPITGMILPDSVAELLTYERVKAVVCMDWGGYPCRVDKIVDIAKDFNVPVIEDAAQSICASVKGTPVGRISDYTCFSFQAIKQLTTGDGGAIAVKSPTDFERARLMRWFGLDRARSNDLRCFQDPPEYGYKFHMNDIAATIGLANIKTLCIRVSAARKNAHLFDVILDRPTYSDVTPSPWVYTLIVSDANRAIEIFKKNDIQASRVHDRNDTKKIFSASPRAPIGVDYFDQHHVCIPVGWWLSENDIDRIVETLKELQKWQLILH